MKLVKKDKNNMKQRILSKKGFIIFFYIFLIGCFSLFIFPEIYEKQCKSRVYEELKKCLTEDVMLGNINIIDVSMHKESDNVEHISYGVGASGGIFYHEGTIYYALTACHVVDDENNTEYIVIPYGEPTYKEYSSQKKKHTSLSEYYSQFSKGTILYYDEEYDLAVISFHSEKDLTVLNISNTVPKFGNHICTIGNPNGEKFNIAFGKVKSRENFVFDSLDGRIPVKTLKHNAYVASGSSGSVVLNNNMEIVGINIGGATDFLGRFKYGVMIPCDFIQKFLNQWKNNNK